MEELYDLIKKSCSMDHSAVSLTQVRNQLSAFADIEPEQCCIQEILCYLVMFIRAEPALFREMLRLRIGLIYEVMIFELSRVLDCESKKIHTVLFHQTIPCNIV